MNLARAELHEVNCSGSSGNAGWTLGNALVSGGGNGRRPGGRSFPWVAV